MISDPKSPVFTFRYLKDKTYYSRKTIAVSLVKVGFPRSKVLWDFISGYVWSIDTEDYIFYRNGDFSFKDKNNSVTLSLLGIDGDIRLIHKPKEIHLPAKTLNSLFTNYFEPTPEECTLFELE